MVTKVLHHVVAHPVVYDLVQTMAGVKQIHHRLARQIRDLPAVTVLDIGGGTGLLRHLWPQGCTYMCLDIDPVKLAGFRGKHPDGIALLADAAAIPLDTGSVDLVLCTFVAHHLNADLLARLIAESSRVLKPAGVFVFVDPLWEPQRAAGRLLWRYDRGSCPRTAATLHALLTIYFDPFHTEDFAIFHRYLMWLGRPRQGDIRV